MTRRDLNAYWVSTLPSPLLLRKSPPLPPETGVACPAGGSLMSGDSTSHDREHGRGVAADDLCLLLLGEYRPCPRPFPHRHSCTRQGVAVARWVAVLGLRLRADCANGAPGGRGTGPCGWWHGCTLRAPPALPTWPSSRTHRKIAATDAGRTLCVRGQGARCAPQYNPSVSPGCISSST